MTDAKIEEMVATVLRGGVLVAGSVVLAGGIWYLATHGSAVADYHKFHTAEGVTWSLKAIVAGVTKLRAQALIQLGVLLLIATPVVRVAVALVGFVLERDRKFMAITALVLALLLISLGSR